MNTDPNKPYCESSIRQHYAGLAMQGLLANEVVCQAVANLCGDGMEKGTRLFAKSAVENADALIAALNAPPAQEVEG